MRAASKRIPLLIALLAAGCGGVVAADPVTSAPAPVPAAYANPAAIPGYGPIDEVVASAASTRAEWMADEATLPAERSESREPVYGFLVRGGFEIVGPLGVDGDPIGWTATVGRVVFDGRGRDLSVDLWRPGSPHEPYPDLPLEQKPVFGPGYRDR